MPAATSRGKAAKPSPGKAAAVHSDDASDVRIHGRVRVAQVEKACAALSAHRAKASSAAANGAGSGGGSAGADELPLEGDDNDEGAGARANPADTVWLQVTVKTLSANAPPKPVRIPLPHSAWPKSASICLLTADPQRTYKDLMVADKITQVQRVVGVTKLKGKFAPFEARRQLMNDHDVFLADDRILPMLPKLLGRKWIEDRKSPIPVKLTRTKDGRVRREIEAAQAATYFNRNKGTCSSIRIGTLRHLTSAQLSENVEAALPVIVGKHIKGNWENVQSIDIKTGTSASLPVWNCKVSDRWVGVPEPKVRASVVAGSDEEDVSDEAKASSTVRAPKKAAKSTAATGAKADGKAVAKTRSSTSAAVSKPTAKAPVGKAGKRKA